jgi:hypothetical protein
MLDPDPDEMNADPQPCVQGRHLPGFEGYACALCSVVSASYRGFEQHVPKHGIVLSKYQLLANIQPFVE